MTEASVGLRANQVAFDAALPQLLEEHSGEIVVFANGELWKLFGRYETAYRDALAEFGTEGHFLLSEVKERPAMPVSFSLDAGLLFGQV